MLLWHSDLGLANTGFTVFDENNNVICQTKNKAYTALISAAPELAKACKLLIELVEHLEKYPPPHTGEWEAVEIARAAIDKAKGYAYNFKLE